MSCQIRCEVKEGRRYRVDEVLRSCEVKGCGGDDARILLVNAMVAMSHSVRSGRREVEHSIRRLLGYDIRLDCPAPGMPYGDYVYSGFWVGVFEYVSNGGRVMVTVRPRISKYVEMLDTVHRELGSITTFYLLSNSMNVSSFTIASYALILRLMHEINSLLMREPRYIHRTAPSTMGRITVTNHGLMLTRDYHVLNTQLYSAIAIAFRNLVESMRSMEVFVKSNVSGDVRGVVMKLMDSVKHGLVNVDSLEIGHALSMEEVPGDLGKYWYLPLASARLRRGRGYVASLVSPSASVRFALVPSTKIYELYVYSMVAEAMKNKFGGLRECRTTAPCVEADGLEAYFNHSPWSRIIARISHKRPSPDIVLAYRHGTYTVIEAKYRRLRTLRLHLPDAIRLSAYLLDNTKDSRLTAYVAALDLMDHRRRELKRKLDSIGIRVKFIEVNPERPEDAVKGVGLVIDELAQGLA